LGVELLLRRVLTFEQRGVNTLANVCTRFSQDVEQAAGAGALTSLQRGGIMPGPRLTPVQSHQQVDVDFIGLLIRRQVRGAKLLADELGARTFDELERRLNLRAGLVEATPAALGAGDALQGHRFVAPITYGALQRQGL